MTELNVSFLDDSAAARRARQKRGVRAGLAVSASVTLVWFAYVAASGQFDRVATHWAAAITMVFGSFVAGSTPQGGGAVGFPVLTKLLEVPSEVARSFSLCIQTVGMGCAAASIVLARRRVEWRVLVLGVPVAIVAFVAASLLLSDLEDPFWKSIIPGPYVKVTFTLVLAAMAYVVYLGWRIPIRRVSGSVPTWNNRLRTALVIACVLGGVASALIGSGADVFLYLFVVVLFGVDARVGVPTSVITMAAVSLVGFILMGLIGGHLDVGVDSSGDVVTVDGDAFQPTTSDGEPVPGDPVRFDLFGMWLAAVPIVAWGAPAGAWVASRLSARSLVVLVMALAAAELISTAIFLEELRTDPALLAYAVIGLGLALFGLRWIATNRRRIFQLPSLSSESSLRRGTVEAATDYAEQLEQTTSDDRSDV